MLADSSRAQGACRVLLTLRISILTLARILLDKANITRQLLEAVTKVKTAQNLLLLSSAGADYAERDKQLRLRELIDLEVLAMPKGDPSTGDRTRCCTGSMRRARASFPFPSAGTTSSLSWRSATSRRLLLMLSRRRAPMVWRMTSGAKYWLSRVHIYAFIEFSDTLD